MQKNQKFKTQMDQEISRSGIFAVKQMTVKVHQINVVQFHKVAAQ